MTWSKPSLIISSRLCCATGSGISGEKVTSRGLSPNSNLMRYAMADESLPPDHGTMQS
jgi:hypothetical protein